MRYSLLQSLFLLLLFTLLNERYGLDLHWADWLYQWEGGRWAWRDSWFAAELLHKGGRLLVAALLLMLLALIAASYWSLFLRRIRFGLWYVLCCALLANAAISLLKQATHVDCPWDLLRYGGQYEYVSLFGAAQRSIDLGACFPAGHAGAGYCWMGVYFLVLKYWPRWRWLALITVLLLGGSFGLAQQLRGAHFLSHDLWSLALCWWVAALMAPWLQARPVAASGV